MSDIFSSARRIVIKTGSALVTDDSGHPRAAWLATLAEDIAGLRAEGKQVIVVTSHVSGTLPGSSRRPLRRRSGTSDRLRRLPAVLQGNGPAKRPAA